MGTMAAPIGKLWTRILHIIDVAGPVTTAALALSLWPPVDGGQAPARRDLTITARALTRMARLAYIEIDAWTQRGLWRVAELGRHVLDQIAAHRRRGWRYKTKYKTDYIRRKNAKRRRDELRAEHLCINGRGHGPATRGCRCEHCYQVHRGPR